MERHPASLKTSDSSSVHQPDSRVLDKLRRRDAILIRSAAALSDALYRVEPDAEATPQVARSVQAAENRWRAMEREFGMLDSSEVAVLLGSSPTNRNRAHNLAKEGRILGVQRGRKILYPRFQFDLDAGEIREIIAEVARIGRASGWQDKHLLQWFCSTNGYLEGVRPVDLIEDRTTVLRVAESDLVRPW